jgi:tetratricopeptide (TPR) repeat protein
MQINLKSEFARYSGGDEQVVYVAKVATEYSRGYQELEILIHGPMLALANIYVNRAQHEPNHSDYFITKYLITALSLLPDDMSIKQATIEIIKTWVVRFFKNRPDAPSPAFVGADKSLVNILEYFDSLKMDLEPNDMPLFSRAAYRLAYYYKNAMMVDKGRVPYWEQKAKEWHEKNPVEYFTVADWMNKGYEAYRNKKYDDAVDAYRKAIALDSGFIDAYYNLACIYSLRGDQSAACDWLAEAIDKGYKNWGNIERDRDLNNIRNSECYKRIREKR